MVTRFRGIRLATLLMAVAGIAVIFGVGLQLYRELSPVRRYIRESRPGNSSRVRMQAILNLTYSVPQSELEEGFPVLLVAARDPDPWVRASAVRGIGSRRNHFAEVFPIVRGLLKDESPRVRECAILALETLVRPGSSEASTLIPELLAALDDATPTVRLEACRAFFVLGRLQANETNVVPAMVRLVREEIGTYRLEAMGYLMMMNMVPRELEPDLRALLSSRIPDERISSRRALILLGVPDQERDVFIKSMIESTHPNERFVAASILIELGKPEMAISALNALIASDDTAMRSRARAMRLRARALLPTMADEDELP